MTVPNLLKGFFVVLPLLRLFSFSRHFLPLGYNLIYKSRDQLITPLGVVFLPSQPRFPGALQHALFKVHFNYGYDTGEGVNVSVEGGLSFLQVSFKGFECEKRGFF
jgi:hypothetical protein